MSKYYKEKDIIKAIESDNTLTMWQEQFAINTLKSLPTIDIVRCEDCRHSTYTVKNRVTHETFYACPYSCINHEGKFFCAYGERIEK